MSAQTFDEKLAQLGIVKEEQTNWSEATEVSIPEPNCAYVNITNISSMPTTKEDDLHALMEVYDCNGNYFKKCVILNAQGNSSMLFVKKNISVAFCGSEWDEEKTPSLNIGDWVSQDSYHLKAYYTDYFRGTATVGYKLYDQINKERGRFWSRAPEGSIKAKDLNEKARCYPDGFPCAIYLNGNFYGLYSWQLKKNKDNMNMKKSAEAHIHLDGTLNDNNLWRGDVRWTAFEVRNPKTLYTMTGEKYDGDHPQELIDETSSYYDLETDDEKVKANKQMTAKVKQYILTLSNYFGQLKALEDNGANQNTIKNQLEEYFDVPGLIDYICFHYAINNFDGFAKNWQWFTYDGIKWFVAPYDLDCTFGNFWTGDFTLPAEFNQASSAYTYKDLELTGPIYWIRMYYWAEIKERYKELRDNGILSPENIKSVMENWYYRFGHSNYSQEWTKWPNSKCISETICNENWTTIDDWSEYSYLSEYSATKTYYEGDKCRLSERVWVATGETTGVSPYRQLGYSDNLDRVKGWIDHRIELEDDYLGYNASSEQLTSYTLQISNAGWATVCVPFGFVVPSGMKVYTVTGTQGENVTLEKEQVMVTTEANKPYLINGSPGFYQLSGYTEEADELDESTYLVNRLLRGTYTTTTAPLGSYVLQNQNGRIGFYQVNTDNITVVANRAWLILPESKANARSLYFDGGTTSIQSVSGEKRLPYKSIYTAKGEQLSKLQRGVNIVRSENGVVNKVVVK